MLGIDTIRELILPAFRAVSSKDWIQLTPLFRHFPYYTLHFEGCAWLKPTAYFWPENSNKKGKKRVYVTKKIGNCPYLRIEYCDAKYIKTHIDTFYPDAVACRYRGLMGRWILRCEPKQHYSDPESWVNSIIAVDTNVFRANKPSSGKWKIILDPNKAYGHAKTSQMQDISEMVCTLSATKFEEMINVQRG